MNFWQRNLSAASAPDGAKSWFGCDVGLCHCFYGFDLAKPDLLATGE